MDSHMIRILTLILVVTAALLASPARADFQENWDAILKEHTGMTEIQGIPVNAIDYAAVKADPRWAETLERMAAAEVPPGRIQRLAFWSNVYNVLAVKVVLDDYPTESIMNLDAEGATVWKKHAGTVAGQIYSLDEVEHQILRPLGEPLIHATVVCAALSCPDLRPEAFTADRYFEQAEEQMRKFLATPEKGARWENGKLYLSSIFDWFGEDFEQGGMTLRDSLIPYLPEDIAIKVTSNTEIEFMEYHWPLNDLKRK